ncbi:zona pellucida sperm-binding protein 3 [Sebastes fasciatus]|uniref:zona pellucida sperm-binding protein 3 n=1 Tax=Sebastes fasciatus TaxID=394691 RepID=UPI003D9DC17E
MDLMHAGIVLLLFCSAYSYQFRYDPFVQDPEREWERMETVIGEEMTEALAPETKFLSASGNGSSTPEAKTVPEYLVVSKDQKEVFKPEKGARPLPDSAKEMLLKTVSTTPATAGTARPKLVEILCHVDRIYVRIRREVFKTRDAYKYLKLGTCPVNQGTKNHYYLLYLLKTDCGFKRQSNAAYRSISNTLHYKPTSPVLREMPFDIPLQCRYPRLFHSYKVGFYPKLQGGTVFKALKSKGGYTLTPQDASGYDITGPKTYTLGQPMYFEAKRANRTASSGDKRIYINKCFMTASQNPSSDPKYTVIDNQGCMIDGKATELSKFLPCTPNMAQKFSVGALVFKDQVSTSSSSQQLYMHCELSMGKLTPTPSSKACNYVPATKKWKALFGEDSVCACCDSTCSLAKLKASRNMISSHSWKVDLSSQADYDEFEPRMKSLDADTFSLEDPAMGEHQDFLKYWEHDY